MVKYVIGLLLLSCSVFAQTTLLDDISLQDLHRNAQLLNGMITLLVCKEDIAIKNYCLPEI